MDRILYFDYAAVAIFALLIASFFMRGMTRGRLNLFFIHVLSTALAASTFDILSVVVDGRTGTGWLVAAYTVNTIYMLVHTATAPMYSIYLLSVTDAWYVSKGRGRMWLYWLPFELGAALLFVNLFYPCVFSISDSGIYTREAFLPLLYLEAVLYMIVGVTMVMKHRKILQLRKVASVLFIFPLVTVAAICQMMWPHVLIEMFANAMGLLIAAMMIQGEDQISSTTGLSRVGVYMDDLRNVLAGGGHVCIIMMNLENSKPLKDVLGLNEYHRLLHQIADNLTGWAKQRHLRVEMYYLGNGLFRCIMDGGASQEAADFAEYVNGEFKKGYHYHDIVLNIMMNVCITDCPEDIDNVNTLMRFGAELAGHKYNGEVIYAKDIYKESYYSLICDMDMIIERALLTGGFSVYYQPIYSIREGRYNSAEALLRLQDDKYGFISPEIFIPAAENNGTIHQIGQFVFEEVCKFISGGEFTRLGLEYIEVNLSVMQCSSRNLVSDLTQIMNKYGVKPNQINLEITETAATDAQSAMLQNIDSLTASGIEFSLDDFGTGYSNFMRLAQMPLTIVKLDKTFADAGANWKMAKAVENAIHMLKDMRFRIVVEGVETKEMFEQFADYAVDYIQGYYFSRPLPEKGFIEEVQRMNKTADS